VDIQNKEDNHFYHNFFVFVFDIWAKYLLTNHILNTNHLELLVEDIVLYVFDLTSLQNPNQRIHHMLLHFLINI